MSKKKVFKVKSSDMDKNFKDPKFVEEITKKITDYIIETKQCSPNRIIMNFSISFNLCQQILKDLEEKGIISKLDETRQRKVLI